MRRSEVVLAAFLAVILLLLAGDLLGQDDPDHDRLAPHTHDAQGVEVITVEMVNASGQIIGQVVLQNLGDKVLVNATVSGLEPGFHGFHIHETGLCEVTDEGVFVTAGGHFDHADSDHDHGGHAGDLPVLLVGSDGTALQALLVDAFELDDLLDADGSSMIIHADADNFANIPARYGGPDAETLKAGDSGPRVACGVIVAPR